MRKMETEQKIIDFMNPSEIRLNPIKARQLEGTDVRCMLGLDYIAGFFDGEGCISIGFGSKACRQKSRRSWWPHVKISIANTNKMILEKIRSEIKVGNIYKKHYKSKWNDAYYLVIGDVNETLNFLTIMEKKVVSKLSELMIAQDACRFIIDNRRISKGRWSEGKLALFKLNFVDKLRVVPNSKRMMCGRKRKFARPSVLQ